MAKDKEKKKQGGIELPSSQRSGTSREEINSQATDAVPPIDQPKALESKTTRNVAIGTGGIGAVSLFLYFFGNIIFPHLDPITQYAFDQYRFQVYCPFNKLTNFSSSIDNSILQPNFNKYASSYNELRVLTQQAQSRLIEDDGIDKYLIYVKMMNTSTDINSSYFFYCSYVTDWITRNCSEARPICTVPGPIFYVKRNQPIDVAWVYNIDYNTTYKLALDPKNDKSCYTLSNDHCVLDLKNKGDQSCTYLDPTKISLNNPDGYNYTISSTSIPIDVHIHGLEVRPTFDGNPLSWLGVDGAIGSGFQSLLNEKYYSTFRNSTTTGLKANQNINHIYTKVNRYQNFQPPGNLWYHDHSMHVTRTNVVLGLAGDYIIYDQDVDKQLPPLEYQILIVIGQQFNKINNSVNNQVGKTEHEDDNTEHGIKINPHGVPLKTHTNLTFERNQAYRIRILNGQFDSMFTDLQFRTQCNENMPHPIDPNSSKAYLLSCSKVLNFSVIGADSSLFDKPIYPTSKVTISSAERYQILIIFDGISQDKTKKQNTISQKAKIITLGSTDGSIISLYTLQPRNNHKTNIFKKLPSQVNLIKGVSFYDLNQVNAKCDPNSPQIPSTMCISAYRMRPIFFSSRKFFFNGHYMFSTSGRSDNPKIGTTEDWFFINTMNFSHPIHVHLINYQIIGKTRLRLTEDHNCSLYQIDFYNQTNIPQIVKLRESNASQSQFCQVIKKLNVSNDNVSDYLNDYVPQNQKSASFVSGKDIFELVKKSTNQKRINDGCPKPNSKYKYICDQFSVVNVPLEQRRWKEVATVTGFEVIQVRIRWTSTQYNTSVSPFNGRDYPYFNVPQDELIEFPGYVYHCHILSHQDNELMRPIMMQPSDHFVKEYNTSATPLGECMKRRNLDNKDGWAARYECINELSGCAA